MKVKLKKKRLRKFNWINNKIWSYKSNKLDLLRRFCIKCEQSV